MEELNVNNEEVDAIKKVIIINEDGSREEIEQALVVDYSLEGEDVGVSMRFHNLSMQDIDNIFLGFKKLLG